MHLVKIACPCGRVFLNSTLKEVPVSLQHKPIELVEEVDLHGLVDNKVSEGRMLDYKEQLPGKTDSEKREFLADVSSFANASGGHLIYGIRETSGIPTDLCGVQCQNPDLEITRLDNIIRDGIEPRIPGIRIRPLLLRSMHFVFLIWVPRSWALPHRVKFQKDFNFYSRNSSGKYPLDVSELRSLFMLSANTTEQIRLFRTDRINKIISGETNVSLPERPKTMLLLVPFSFLDPAVRYDVSRLENVLGELMPIDGHGWSFQHNFDGFMTYSSEIDSSLIYSYLQFFRHGSCEAVSATIPILNQEKKYLRVNIAFENELLKCLERYLRIQKDLGVEPPLAVLLSFISVNGYTIKATTTSAFSQKAISIKTDVLMFPEIIVDTYGMDIAQMLKPVFDTIWNAAGFSRSFGYNEKGQRING
jgi:hypothetical protein